VFLALDMHVHAGYFEHMRTTVEITDEQRSRLLAIAAERGLKGFSGVVREALDEYLAARAAAQNLIEKAQATRGALDEQEAEALTRKCAVLRKSWR